MSMAQAYTRFMALFLAFSTLPDVFRFTTDAPGSGFFLWPDAGRTFGIFLVNWVHVVSHYALALWAVWALRRHGSSRAFAAGVFVVAGLFLLTGLLTPDGVWLVPAHWPADAANGTITASVTPSWYGLIPANWPDDVLDFAVALSGLIFGLTPYGDRAWGYWRRAAAAPTPAGD
jgi:hypothetical protein